MHGLFIGRVAKPNPAAHLNGFELRGEPSQSIPIKPSQLAVFLLLFPRALAGFGCGSWRAVGGITDFDARRRKRGDAASCPWLYVSCGKAFLLTLLTHAYLRVKEKWEGPALVHFSKALRQAVQDLEALKATQGHEHVVCLEFI